MAFIVKGAAQSVKVIDSADAKPIPHATVSLGRDGVKTSDQGIASSNSWLGKELRISAVGYATKFFRIEAGENLIALVKQPTALDPVVVSGTLKPVLRSKSPIAVSLISGTQFKKIASNTVFDALQLVNGVRPQVNCNVCNTGDIRINGMDGPYTLVLIDGMPLISSLGAVYGLTNIPASLVDRIELVKGPASSLYGSEAMGGVINIITKTAAKAPKLFTELNSNSWGETSLEWAVKTKLSTNFNLLTGMNTFLFNNRIDKNGDGFTDLSQQKRAAVFTKLNGLKSQFLVRYMYEDRWGGQTNWSKTWRGSDSIYAESIYTSRLEVLGDHQFSTKIPLKLSGSYVMHKQNSFYGTTSFNASQQTGFLQLVSNKTGKRFDYLLGTAVRFNGYDDNTLLTKDSSTGKSIPTQDFIPGAFAQLEWRPTEALTLLAGARMDYHPVHGWVFTPRFAGKWNINELNTVRFSTGMGFRTVQVFTEDHAALTGARKVEFKEALKPERSTNISLQYTKTWSTNWGWWEWESNFWYSIFSNKIIPDYTTDANKIIYANNQEGVYSKGISTSLETAPIPELRFNMGLTLQDIFQNKNGKRERLMFTEAWSVNAGFSYYLNKRFTFDYSCWGYGGMRLPLQNNLDPRPAYSKPYSIHNIQISYKAKKGVELYSGIRNLFNWTPSKETPFLIARSNDPFDKQVSWDPGGQPRATPNNPYALTFDPNYVFAPNQGIRMYAGCRISIN